MTSPIDLRAPALALALTGLIAAVPATAQYRQYIDNDPARCRGDGPAVSVTVTGLRSAAGKVRVQLYNATKRDWLEKGRWLNRIELPARAGSMTFCMPVPAAGSYGIGVRHDVNNNGESDLTQDGGGMSNNPSINIFNLGKPSYDKVALAVGNEIKAITIRMRYM